MIIPSSEGKENARKAREYADRVLYKDMDKVFYHMFGVENDIESRISIEKTLKEMIEAINRSIRNLSRHYNRQNMTENLNRLNRFSDAFIKATEILYC